MNVQGNLEEFMIVPEIDSSILTQNPSLAFVRQQVDVAQWQRKLEAARALPDFRVGYFNQTLIGMQNVNGQDQYFDSNKRFQGIQVGIAFPLWIGPHTARIRAASVATEVAKKQYESFNLYLTQQYNQAIQELNKNRNSLNYYRDSALKTADLLIYQSRLSFKSGQIDHTGLLLNLRQALAIREGYLMTMQQYNQTLISIDYLNGKI
jgi:cobalt-zinc-cadmium resistance protein CzcA